MLHTAYRLSLYKKPSALENKNDLNLILFIETKVNLISNFAKTNDTEKKQIYLKESEKLKELSDLIKVKIEEKSSPKACCSNKCFKKTAIDKVFEPSQLCLTLATKLFLINHYDPCLVTRQLKMMLKDVNITCSAVSI